jgi:hypothetical protein
MFTIIYDGNFFVQKTLAISLDLFKTNQTKKQKENSKLEFITTLCIHITSDFRKFSSISDSVIFCVDSKSWRKEFNTEYKGTRTKSSELDWDLYYECFNDFINILKLNNIVVSKVDSCEADDLYWYWINRLKNEDKSSITLSADRDLLQLMYSNEFSDNIFYSPTQKKIYTTPEFKEKTDLDILEIDIFNVDSNSIYDKLNDFITTNKLDIDYTIKTEEFLFKKILIGDKGDNIKSVYVKEGEKRNIGISDKKAELILEKYYDNNFIFTIDDFFNDNYKDNIIKYIIELFKLETTEEIFNKIKHNIESNIKLMLLSEKTIPDTLIENIKKIYDNVDYKTNIYKFSNKDKLIENSKYGNKQIEIEDTFYFNEVIKEDNLNELF